jgi:molybdopterin molybdotransferase
VTFLLLGRPLVQRLSGAEVRHLLRAAARAGFSHRKPPGRREYLRARLVPGADGLPVAEVFGNDSSGAITSMTWADALVELPEAAVEIAPGDPIRVIAFECLLQP